MADYKYSRLTWTNNQTRLNAANMNNIEKGIEDATNGLNAVTAACNNYTDTKIKEAITEVLNKPV